MKKLLLSILLACTLVGVRAQDNAAYAENTLYWSVGGGAGGYWNQDGMQIPTFGGGVAVGRWLMRPLAFQIAADITMAPPHQAPDAGNALYFMGSAEFLWDIESTIGRAHNRSFGFYPMIGLGALYQLEGDGYSADRDFQGMFGLHFALNKPESKWAFFAELKWYFLPYSFDGSYMTNHMPMLNIGVTHRSYTDPFHRRTPYETRNIREDWFTGFGVGILFNSFEFEQVGNWDSKLYNITGDMMFGRNWSDIWTIRFELSGYFGRERYNAETETPGRWYTFNCLHTDFMVNLSHLANFNRGLKWNFLTYLGAGPVWRYQNPVFTIGANAGIMARRYIDEKGDFYVDLKYLMVPPRLAGGTGGGGSFLGVGYPMLTVGYINNFGHSFTRYRTPVGGDKYKKCRL